MRRYFTREPAPSGPVREGQRPDSRQRIASRAPPVDNVPAMTRKKQSGKTPTHTHSAHSLPGFHVRSERLAFGKTLRERVPRESHAEWKAPRRGRDPIAILEASNRGRLQELVPIRYGRMVRSPFTFLRGSAALMAHDLATTAGHRHRRAGVRRLPPAQLRRVCDARAQPGLRPQRFRRDASGAVGMGPEAPGRELPGRGAGQSPVGRRRPPRGAGVRARLSRASARVLEDEAAGSLVPAHGCEGADRRGARRRRAQIPAADRQARARTRPRKSLSQDHDAGRRAPPHRRSAADPVPCRRAGLRGACRRGVGGLPQHRFPTIAACCWTATGWRTARSRWWASAASVRVATSGSCSPKTGIR